MNQIPRLRFRKTREIYQSFKTSQPVINFFFYGFLYWVECHVVDYKVKTEVDVAIINYKNELPEEPEVPWKPPTITEEYKSTTIPLPELRSSYDWIERKEEDVDK